MEDLFKKISDFQKKESKLQKLIVIYGPTASGKTSASIELASLLNTEIVSTDSRQIFKYMDIGTGKITEKEKKGIIHHMIDIIEPTQRYSSGDFKNDATEVISKLYKDNKIPILCGGTGLYIDSLIYDFSFPQVEGDPQLRAQMNETLKKNGKQALYNELVEIDPVYAEQIHPNNTQYVMRGIEVKKLTGKSKLEYNQEKKLKYDVFFYTPYIDSKQNRTRLYHNINKRVEQMFEIGLHKEIKKLLSMGYKFSDFGMKSIGYAEFKSHYNSNSALQEVKEEIQKNSRNYAKRQITWFKKYSK